MQALTRTPCVRWSRLVQGQSPTSTSVCSVTIKVHDCGRVNSRCETSGESLHEKQLILNGRNLNVYVRQPPLTSTIVRRRCRWRWNSTPRIITFEFLLCFSRPRGSMTSGRYSEVSRLQFFYFKGGKISQAKLTFVKRTR